MNEQKIKSELDKKTELIKAKWEENQKLIADVNERDGVIMIKKDICERCQKNVPKFHMCFKCERCGSTQGSPYEIEESNTLPSGGFMCVECLAQYREW